MPKRLSIGKSNNLLGQLPQFVQSILSCQTMSNVVFLGKEKLGHMHNFVAIKVGEWLTLRSRDVNAE